MAAKWQFLLRDRNFVPVGELLNAFDRKVAKPISKVDTASFRLRLDNPLAEAVAACDGYVIAFRNKVPMFYGPVISAEETGASGEAGVAVNCASAGWFLQKRLAGKSALGTEFATATDRALIAKALIDAANTESLGSGLPASAAETGISTTGSISSGSAISYTAGPYKPILECINELSVAYDGFDWRIDPIDNYSNGAVTGQKLGSFLAAPKFGTRQQHSVFEWGTGLHNMASFKRTTSRETQANKVYHYTSSGPDAPGYPTLTAIRAASITNYKLLEDLAQADLLDPTLRSQFLEEMVAIRQYPRQLIEFAPSLDPGVQGRVPQFGTDYALGDEVRGRASYGSRTVFDAWFRVWGVSFDINNLGVEVGSLTLAEEAA